MCLFHFFPPSKPGDTASPVVAVPSRTTHVCTVEDRRAASTVAAWSTNAKPALSKTNTGSTGGFTEQSLPLRSVFPLHRCGNTIQDLHVLTRSSASVCLRYAPPVIGPMPRMEAKMYPIVPCLSLKLRGSLEQLAERRRWLLCLCDLNSISSAVQLTVLNTVE